MIQLLFAYTVITNFYLLLLFKEIRNKLTSV